MEILEKLYPLSTNNMVVKKNTCFSHLLCFLPHNYLQYFLNSGDSNSRKKPSAKCERHRGSAHSSSAQGRLTPRMLWWPFPPAVSEMHIFCADIQPSFQNIYMWFWHSTECIWKVSWGFSCISFCQNFYIEFWCHKSKFLLYELGQKICVLRNLYFKNQKAFYSWQHCVGYVYI